MYMHSKGIMHRDLKPENMFLVNDELLKLGDFGVSKEIDAQINLTKTMCGTPNYMAPEVCKGIKYGYQADMWALGCAFYEIMCFRPPFEGKTIP